MKRWLHLPDQERPILRIIFYHWRNFMEIIIEWKIIVLNKIYKTMQNIVECNRKIGHNCGLQWTNEPNLIKNLLMFRFAVSLVAHFKTWLMSSSGWTARWYVETDCGRGDSSHAVVWTDRAKRGEKRWVELTKARLSDKQQ